MGRPAKVAVLLCTYNGALYLEQQLNSIIHQKGVSVAVHASDDGSTDTTLDILSTAQSDPRALISSLRAGPRKGFASNFLSLLCDPVTEADYYAYADQDDVWDEDKLQRAVEALDGLDPALPALYCSATRSISVAGGEIGVSPRFRRAPSFRNALIHNIAGGNTMVMNDVARRVLMEAGVVDVVAHDWWTYLLISGAGGSVCYDPRPGVSYRQHAGNLVGANTGSANRVRRYWGFLRGLNRDWNAANLDALRSNKELLTTENQHFLRLYEQMRNEGVIKRLQALLSAGFYAQTISGNLGLLTATLLRKI